MKGGLAIMLAALKAVESTPAAARIGYQVLIDSDEVVGSPSSTALIARLTPGDGLSPARTDFVARIKAAVDGARRWVSGDVR